LPAGWDVLRSESGRTFYVDHVGKSTQWAHPALDEEGLRSGWQMQIASNGRVFYINHEDRETTWDDPRDALPKGWEERVSNDGRWATIIQIIIM
jgi:uncharacterized protein YbdZ (MbtH family)